MGATYRDTGLDLELRCKTLLATSKALVRSALLEHEKLPVAFKRKPENLVSERRLRMALMVLCEPIDPPDIRVGDSPKNGWRQEYLANAFEGITEAVDDFMAGEQSDLK
jgi:hypothetical protein